MNRRDLVKFAPLAFASAASGSLRRQMEMHPAVSPSPQAPHSPAHPADPDEITLRIAPVIVELSPSRTLSTIGYNGRSPGPVLRMKEGRPVTVNVINDTDSPEYVHWHGMLIPASVDGVKEEGTPVVPPHDNRRYHFTPTPSGSRWYHSHAMAMSDLHKGTYTGQFGFVYVEPASHPGNYDQEFFLALRDWEPFFFSSPMWDMDDIADPTSPQPEKPATLSTVPNGLEVSSATYSINDKALGAGEPIRVAEGQRVLFHFLNASAIENRLLFFAGHKFQVIALDGNPVPNPALVDTLLLGAGERVCAIVEMNNPGNWILAEPNTLVRNSGLGIYVEYANQSQRSQITVPRPQWDYTAFADQPGSVPSRTRPRAQNIDMVFEKIPGGPGKFNTFTVNGKPSPHDDEFVLHEGQRYRLIFRNRTDDAHPLHLHRHQLELVDFNGKPTSGLIKDTVVVPRYGRAAVEFTADQPGLALFHCHIQSHMDYGFNALFRYA